MGNIYNIILSMFMLIGVGAFSKKYSLLSENSVKELSKFIINVIIPSLIILSFQREFDKKILQNSSTIIIFSFIYILFLLVFYFALFSGVEKSKRSVVIFLSVFTNTVYMGFPVVYQIWGDLGIFYAAVFNFVHAVFLWTIGVNLLKGGNDKLQLKKLINIPMMTMAVGFVMFFFSIKLPVFLTSTFKMLGSASTPLAMIVVGYSLASMEKNNIFQRKILVMAVFKLFIMPIALIFLCKFINLDKMILGIILIESAMPCPANSVLMARTYNADYHLVSKGVFISTLLSVISIPLIIFIFEKI